MKIIILLFFCLICTFSKSQTFADSFTSAMFPEEVKQSKPGLLKPKNRAQKINPLFFTGSVFLFLYQNVISEQIQANCNFHISCSESARRGIYNYGLLRGMLVGINQLTSCLPGVHTEFPITFISHDSKIDNSVYFSD
jgi:putative component of membrane protein insertase Oxa1/YidC/SpoIIIJ protein YidD